MAVVTEEVAAGATVCVQSPAGSVNVVAREAIPAGHKIAVRNVACASPVRKYGERIGVALRDIHTGDHVHLHNLAGERVKAS